MKMKLFNFPDILYYKKRGFHFAFYIGGIEMLEGVNKKYIVCGIAIVVIVIAIFVVSLFSEHGPSSSKALMKGCVEYIMKEYGAEKDGKDSWSNYKENKDDLKLDKGSAVDLCRTLGKADVEEEEDARKYVLQGVSYTIQKCEVYDDIGLVTVEMELPTTVKATSTFTFNYKAGNWKVDPESVYSVLSAGNGIGGSGNYITDIFDALAS